MNKNLLVDAGDMGSIPGWSRKILHMVQLSLSTITTEPASRAWEPQEKSKCRVVAMSPWQEQALGRQVIKSFVSNSS